MADVIRRVSTAARTSVSKKARTPRASIIDRAMSPPEDENDWKPQKADKMKSTLNSPSAPMMSLADSAMKRVEEEFGPEGPSKRLVPLLDSGADQPMKASGSLVQALVMVVGEERARSAAADFVAEEVTTIAQLLELGFAEMMTLGKIAGLNRVEMCKLREAALEVQAQQRLESEKVFGTPRPGEFELGREAASKGLGSCRSCVWFGAKTKKVRKATSPPRQSSPLRATSPVTDRRRGVHQEQDFYAHVPLSRY